MAERQRRREGERHKSTEPLLLHRIFEPTLQHAVAKSRDFASGRHSPTSAREWISHAQPRFLYTDTSTEGVLVHFLSQTAFLYTDTSTEGALVHFLCQSAFLYTDTSTEGALIHFLCQSAFLFTDTSTEGALVHFLCQSAFPI